MAEEYFSTPSDSIGITEAFIRGLVKPLADTATFSDSEIEGLVKVLSDTLSVSESSRRYYKNTYRCCYFCRFRD